MILPFLIGLLAYAALAHLSYSEFKTTGTPYYLTGLGIALLANACWLWIARMEPNASKLVFKALAWDVMLTLTYLVIPILFFSVRLTPSQIFGVILIFAGIILTKI